MPKYQYSHTYINTHSAEKVFLYYVELITWYENASTAGGITKLNYNWRNADLAKRWPGETTALGQAASPPATTYRHKLEHKRRKPSHHRLANAGMTVPLRAGRPGEMTALVQAASPPAATFRQKLEHKRRKSSHHVWLTRAWQCYCLAKRSKWLHRLLRFAS